MVDATTHRRGMFLFRRSRGACFEALGRNGQPENVRIEPRKTLQFDWIIEV